MAKNRLGIDETVVAAHADDMARIVPLLGIEDLASFWLQVRQCWTAADLAAAIDTFKADGSLEPFQTMLLKKFETKRRGKRGDWKLWENCEATLREIETSLGRFPTDRDLFTLGHGGLRYALQQYHGGYNASRERYGASILHVKESSWRSADAVHADLRRVQTSIGRFPTAKDLVDLNEHGIINAIGKHHGGLNAVRRAMGADIVRQSTGHWLEWERVNEDVLSLIALIGKFPGYSDFELHGRLDLYMGIRKNHGGVNEVRHRMGYGPVTDETIAANADALAKIIPALGANPTVLWSRMKRSWTVRDLDSAVAAHAATGSLDAFRRLLDAPAIP